VSYALADRLDEFERHVWNHSEDPFQLEFDTRKPLTAAELGVLSIVIAAMAAGHDDAHIASLIRRELSRDERLMLLLLQMAGLTRTKILTDLRAATAGGTRRIPSSPQRLHAEPDAWELAGPYLVSRLRKVLQPLCLIKSSEDLRGAMEAVNQATWPGWIRQERAKRQGHEAEGRLANMLAAVGIPFDPAEKADNPLCGDVQIAGISFDLVVPALKAPLVCVKATVHTANIGQYGESKDALEIAEAAQMVRKKFDERTRPTILALIDGVGFRSNRSGLEAVLTTADEFCQFKSIWKAAVVAAAAVRERLVLGLPPGEAPRHAAFLDRYRGAVEVRPLTDEFRGEAERSLFVDAGEGLIQLPLPS
jgi:hypothetical protein